jgi:hypothetical protein
VVLTAKELGEEFKKDESATWKKYDGKVVELSGTCDGCGRPTPDKAYVSIKELGPEFPIVSVDKEPWKKYAREQQLTIRCKVRGEGRGLWNGEVIDAGPNPSISVTAEEVAKEATENWEAAFKKYEVKPIVLQGKVVGKHPDSPWYIIELVGDGKTKVTCGFDSTAEKNVVAAIQPGQIVRVQHGFLANQKGELRFTDFTDCHLMGPEK